MIEKINIFQKFYYKSIEKSLENNKNLRDIVKEYIEKYMLVKKKIEKIIHISDSKIIKNKYDTMNKYETDFIQRSSAINREEKNFYNYLFEKIIEKNENSDHVKNENLKHALLKSLENIFTKKNLNQIKNEEIKTGLEYLKEKFKIQIHSNSQPKNFELNTDIENSIIKIIYFEVSSADKKEEFDNIKKNNLKKNKTYKISKSLDKNKTIGEIENYKKG